MRLHVTPIIAVLALCSVLPAHATTCRMDNMSREVNVVYEDPGQPLPCRVQYQRGAEQPRNAPLTLWRAEHEVGYCESRAAEFVAKLQKIGWSCAIAADAEVEPEQPSIPSAE